MKAIKRTVAGLLATLMFASCFSFNFAFGADNYTDDEAIAVSKVNAANIMTGTDNGFEPSKTLTRAEAAAIVVRMKGVPASQVEGAKGNTLFTDVPASSWAAGYINAASAMGIISGVGNGLFLPEREVSIVEFSAMAIRALGAGKLVDSIGTWPTNYVNFATEEKLFDGVLKAYTAPATRMDVAFMVVNTIEANMWEKTQVTNTSEVTYEKQVNPEKTLLKDVLKITINKGDFIESIDTKDREVEFKSGLFGNCDVAENVELATLKAGMEVDVWVKAEDKEIIRIAPAENAKVTKVTFTGIKKVDDEENKITLIVNGDEKTYTYVTENDPETNEDERTKFSFNTLKVPSAITAEATGKLTNNDGSFLVSDKDATTSIFGTAILDGRTVTAIYAEAYTNKAVVKEVKNDNIYFEGTSKVSGVNHTSRFELDDEDVEYIVTKNGKEIDLTDVEEGDALYFYQDSEDSDRFVMVVNNNTVEGTAKQVSKSNFVKIDGTKYELADSLASVTINAGDEVKLYLDAKNKVTMYRTLDDAVDSTVALVQKMRETNPEFKDQGAQGSIEIVLLGLDGTELDKKVVDFEASADSFNANNKLKDLKCDECGNEQASCTCGAGNFEDNEITADELRTLLTTKTGDRFDLVGTMVRYSIKKEKVVIKEFNKAGTIVSAYDESKIEFLNGATNAEVGYKEKSQKLTSGYKLTEDTKIYLVKEVASATDAKYSVKFEEIKFADLGDAAKVKGYVFGRNKNTNVVEAVLFDTNENDSDSKVGRTTDKNYAVILECADEFEDVDVEGYSGTATLLLKNGDTLEVMVSDDVKLDLDKGDVIEAFIEDDEKLVDANAVATTPLNCAIYEFNGDGSVYLLDSSNNDVPFAIAEDCIYVEQNKVDFATAKLTKGAENNITRIADSVDTYQHAYEEDTLCDTCNKVVGDTGHGTGDGQHTFVKQCKLCGEAGTDATTCVALETEVEAKEKVKALTVVNTETDEPEIIALFYVAK